MDLALPVAARADEIAASVVDSQVTIVAGETGSGKSTLLPRIAARARPTLESRIAITQPRRVAARAVAARIAWELAHGGCPAGLHAVGELVGFRTRFESSLKPEAPIVTITDGLLLQDLQRDRSFGAYDTLIIDEVHERSVAIDFLLGVSIRLLRQRPELRIVLSSATLDAERLSAHFGGHGLTCTTIHVEGRLHPVDIEWAPPSDDDEILDAAADAIVRLLRTDGGDCLCFLPGEAEIHQLGEILGGRLGQGTEVLPLFARLSSTEQDRVFKPGALPRIILATNIAETSLTVPRIRSVVDTGLARVARYSTRSRVMRLPLEDISRAAAAQRSGRAGRLGPGRCVRLCSEEDFAARTAFTEPEIRRTNLAGVLLRMASLQLGSPERFPFVDQPSDRAISEARDTLRELGAISAGNELTPRGRRIGEFPVDPRLASVLLASIDLGCPAEAAVVTSFLSTTDPRMRESTASRRIVAPPAWHDAKSDFGSILGLWRAWSTAHEEHGSSALKRWCHSSGLSHLRLREWQFIHDQLRRQLVPAGVSVSLAAPSVPDLGKVHRALVHGLACFVAERMDDGQYKLPSGQSVAIHPSSALSHSTSRWIIAAEVVDTGRRTARLCGPIRGEWVASAVHHGLRRTVSDPHWVQETGHAAAWEQVHWGSLVVVQRSRVAFGPIDPKGARDVMIQGALVEGRAGPRLAFQDRNDALLERVRAEEAKRRRTGLLATESELFSFFDQRVPAEIHDWPELRRWHSTERRQDPDMLCFTDADVRHDAPDTIADEDFPDSVAAGSLRAPVRYEHAPGSPSDGATVTLGCAQLAAIPDEGVLLRLLQPLPGHRSELVDHLVKSLPKPTRQRLGTLSAIAESVAAHLRAAGGSVAMEWEAWLRWIGNDPAAADQVRAAWDADPPPVPLHLLPLVEVGDGDEVTLAGTRSPESLLAAWRKNRTGAPPPASPSPSSSSGLRGAIKHHLEFDPRWNELVLQASVLGTSAPEDMLDVCARRTVADQGAQRSALHEVCATTLGEVLQLTSLATRVASLIERTHGTRRTLADDAAEIAERTVVPNLLLGADWVPGARIPLTLLAVEHALQKSSGPADDPAGLRAWNDASRRLQRLTLRVAMRQLPPGIRATLHEDLASLSRALQWMPVAIMAPHLRPPHGSTPTKWHRLADDLDRRLTLLDPPGDSIQ